MTKKSKKTGQITGQINENFPKGRTLIYLPDERIMFEFGVHKNGGFVDLIIRLGEDSIVLGTTAVGAQNIGNALNNAGIRAMAIAANKGDDPLLDLFFPMPGERIE